MKGLRRSHRHFLRKKGKVSSAGTLKMRTRKKEGSRFRGSHHTCAVVIAMMAHAENNYKHCLSIPSFFFFPFSSFFEYFIFLHFDLRKL